MLSTGTARQCASSRLREARSLASSSDRDVGDPVEDFTLLTYRSPPAPAELLPRSSRTARPSFVSANLTLGFGGAVSAYLRPDPEGARRPWGVTRLGPSFLGVVAGCLIGMTPLLLLNAGEASSEKKLIKKASERGDARGGA